MMSRAFLPAQEAGQAKVEESAAALLTELGEVWT
jgi:hypothetical protein